MITFLFQIIRQIIRKDNNLGRDTKANASSVFKTQKWGHQEDKFCKKAPDYLQVPDRLQESEGREGRDQGVGREPERKTSSKVNIKGTPS